MRSLLASFLFLAAVSTSFAAPAFTSASAGTGAPIVFFEIPVSSVAQAKEFYGTLLGWTFNEKPEFPNFAEIITAEGGTLGGLSANPQFLGVEGRGTVVYASVKSVAPTLALAERLGARVLLPALTMAGVGTVAIIRDLDGNPFGLWSDEGHGR
jgi:uncharacterized protein